MGGTAFEQRASAGAEERTSEEQAVLETRGLAVGWGERIVVEGVDLRVEAGTVVSLVGPNGTGKSTILKTITRAIAAKGGSICVCGRDAADYSADEFARKLSVLLTDRVRTDALSCRDIVEAGRYPYTGRMGTLTPADRERVEAAMELVGVSELADGDFMCMSDGQKQRVLLARAICQDPQVLVLDEPTTYLDVRFQADLARILRNLADQRGCCVVASLHELQLARKISDTVVCVKDGRILGAGPPEKVLARETVKRLFDLSEENYRFLYDADLPLRQDPPARSDRLRCGWTTGTCAAAATRAAARMLLSGDMPDHVSLTTPSGAVAVLEVELVETSEDGVSCRVFKDAGDDPDITDGMPVVARVSTRPAPGISIEGGEGVGRVTRPGLDQPVGAAAINSVPRAMIAEQAQEALDETGATGGLDVEISLPWGRRLAGKTFNPRLGIEGGISVLGTSGVVKPMSEDALIASIEAELSMHRAEGDDLVLVSPGNYGADFARDVLGLEGCESVQCSNYLGRTIDMAVAEGFGGILLVGHVGKLAKVAAGVMNTHSRVADARREVIVSHAALAGAQGRVLRRLMDSPTTDDALEVLDRVGLRGPVLESMTAAIHENLQRRAGEVPIECIVFSRVHGLLGESPHARDMAAAIRGQSHGKGRPSAEERKERQ